MHTHSLSYSRTYIFNIDTVHRRGKREAVRFMSSARVFGITFWVVVLHKHSAYFFYFCFCCVQSDLSSLLRRIFFFRFRFKSLHSIGITATPDGSGLRRACDTKGRAAFYKVFNGRKPYGHAVQNIIGFFWSWVEEAGYYDFHVRMLVMDNIGILDYFWVILWDGMVLDWIVGLIPLWILHASLGCVVEV